MIYLLAKNESNFCCF